MKLGGEFLTEDDLRDAGFRKIGHNVRIHSRASIYVVENISIGDHVRIDDFALIVATGGIEIGSHVQVGAFCYLGGTCGIVFEDFATLAPGVKIFSASDDYTGKMLTNPTVPKEYTDGKRGKVTLKRHCIIGAGSVILPGCSLGEGCSVGALSLVKTDLEPWGIYAGVPARRIRDRKKDLLDLEKKLIEEESSE